MSPSSATAARSGPLDIWFITDLVFCNFECPYCCAYTVLTRETTWH